MPSAGAHCLASPRGPTAISDELDAAMEAFRARFGGPPHVFGFHPNTWPQLAAVIRAAVAAGVDLSTAETYRRMGDEPPADDAVI